MNESKLSPDPDLNLESRKIWDVNAGYWDERMADGNDFQRNLVGPATERLLQLRDGERVLESACGNGVMSRRLADLGAEVVACDFAPRMVELAQARSRQRGDSIEFRVVDATNLDELLALGTSSYDAVVCNMAIMDMAEIGPLMTAVPLLLRKGGRFVFSLCHPCFNHSGVTRVLEEEDDGELHLRYSIKVSRYMRLGVEPGLAMVGQPRPQYYFNRTLSELFRAVFQAGMVIDGLEEPAFESTESRSDDVSWTRFSEIPPVLAVRARPS